MIHLPTAVELKICQDYIIQERTRSISLVNCASRYMAKSFPARIRTLTVCTKLTDALGRIELSLVVCCSLHLYSRQSAAGEQTVHTTLEVRSKESKNNQRICLPSEDK
jgi:hypothetical protein